MARKQAQKQLKDPKPAIIGAGITEQWYFKHLQTLRKYRVKIWPRYFGRENAFELDKRVDNVLKDEGFAIVVFDADVSQRNDKERQLVERMKTKYANNKDVLVCDSLPSIEYWFLLHYKDAGRLFKTSNEVVEEIKKYNSQFDKSKKFLENDSWVKDLCDGKRLWQAIERCKQQEDKINRGASVSYSKVYKAIELLEKNR
ncbi:MAG: RloB domain-containing protein [Prevotella sp.]|jgi:hypothetical protein